jgi:hypothetical protein
MEPRIVWRPAVLAAALLLFPAMAGGPAAAGPFTSMSGHWSGGGTLTMSNGTQDRLRCLASYMVGQGGGSLRLNIRCASDNYKFDLLSNVIDNGGAISGEWSEASRNARGSITGQVRGDRIDVVARSEIFTASLSLTTSRNQQSVTIVPQGTEVTRVSLTLSKR